jgi:hypothetical protein
VPSVPGGQEHRGVASEQGAIGHQVTDVLDKHGLMRATVAGRLDVREHAEEALLAVEAIEGQCEEASMMLQADSP